MIPLGRLLWAAAGAVVLPACVFALLVVFLGGAGLCKMPSGSCDLAVGLTIFAAVPVGAILFYAMSGASAGRARIGPFFGRKGTGRKAN